MGVDPAPPGLTASPLLTDLYQLAMAQAYLASGQVQTAVFEFFVRRLPDRRNFLMAAGLEQVLEFLEQSRFGPAELAWLRESGRFDARTLAWLEAFRFAGDVDAMAEGEIFFADEPIVRVVAPLPVAQLVETRLINLLHYQTLVASKAARMVLAAPGKALVDFGLRRAHGGEAGLLAARASYLAGFAGTATTLAGELWGVPLYGTMAHAFVQSFDDEGAAFEAFARARPKGVTFLIDTYDTKAAARKVAAIAPRLQDLGIEIQAVRLDSGDLLALSRGVRCILDAGGLDRVQIFASGGLDEDAVARLLAAGAPIDGFGLGTALTTSSDAPALDCAYKLQEYAGVARRKLSAGKATWPGRKQVWRRFGADRAMCGDLLTLETAPGEGERLLKPVMRTGRRLVPPISLADIRETAARNLMRLPPPLRRLQPHNYAVYVGKPLRQLAEEVDRAHFRTEARS